MAEPLQETIDEIQRRLQALKELQRRLQSQGDVMERPMNAVGGRRPVPSDIQSLYGGPTLDDWSDLADLTDWVKSWADDDDNA